jgi:GTP cyclohydrolase IA
MSMVEPRPVDGDGAVVGLEVELDADLDVILEVRRDPRVQLEEATKAARALLEALGVDLNRDGMSATPARMTRAYAELFSPRPFLATHFANDEGYDQMVLAKQIPFRSVCEHHMLPFTGVAYLGYLPGERILGLSKLARLVEHFAAAPQMQERLTKEIAEWLNKNLTPRGVGVVLEAEHTCMTLRGVQAQGTRMVTSELLGVLRDDPAARAEFFALTGVART